MKLLFIFDPNRIVLVPTVVVHRFTCCDECADTLGWAVTLVWLPFTFGFTTEG